MKKILLIIFGILHISLLLQAQGENNNWAFGHGSGISFNSGNPVFFPSSMNSKEGSAAISDAFGNLLFYSSGNKVWDRNGDLMPNGNIVGNWDGSATQGVLILKSLSNPDEFYVLTLDPFEIGQLQTPRLRYSIVNMTLNNGLGAVRLDAKDIVLSDEMEERMVAVESTDCGYWIVGHKRFSNKYVSIKLTASGFMPPVYSTGTTAIAPHYYAGDIGDIRISPDRTRVAILFKRNRIEMGTFNNNTGMISNTLIVDSFDFNNLGYSLCFSPDNTKLYATLHPDSNLDQYNVALYPDADAMRASRTNVMGNVYVPGTFFMGMRLGPDNKIYLIKHSSAYMSCINAPDNAGTACDLDTQSVLIPPAGMPFAGSLYYGLGLGNNTVNITHKNTLPGRNADTLVCFSDSARLSVQDNLLSYVWNDGTSGASRYVYQDGLYYCMSTVDCSVRMDTFRVRFVKGHLDLGPDTAICPGDSILLQVSGSGFQWQDGNTDSVYTIRKGGVYSVRINQDGCFYTDEVQVTAYQPRVDILENNVLMCDGTMVELHGISTPPGTLTWSTGVQGPSIETGASGNYILSGENVCGTFYDSVWVRVQDCNCRPGMPNAFSPNADGRNDEFKPVLNCNTRGYMLSVYNRYGQRIFSSANQERGWDGRFNGNPADAGTYFYYLQYETPHGERIQRKGDVVLLR